MAQFAGGFNVGGLLFTFGPYDQIVLSDAPKAFWPMNDKDAAGWVYDTVIADDSPFAFWPMNDKDTV